MLFTEIDKAILRCAILVSPLFKGDRMNYRQGYSFFDRQELIEKARQLHTKLFGKRPDAEVYSALYIRSLEAVINELRGQLIRKWI